ncbi:hypothetical protein AMECASPLE_037515, partial [Ameca splendens]
ASRSPYLSICLLLPDFHHPPEDSMSLGRYIGPAALQHHKVCVSSLQICRKTSRDKSRSQRHAGSEGSLRRGLRLWDGGYRTPRERRDRVEDGRGAERVLSASRGPRPTGTSSQPEEEECMLGLF